MPVIPLSLGRRSNTSRYGHEGGGRLVNALVEDIGEDGKSRYAVYAVDGITQWLGFLAGSIRAMLAIDGSELFVVAGRTIYSISPSRAATVIGALISDGPVTIARSRGAAPQIAFCCDGSYQVFRTSDRVMVQVSDADLITPNSVCSFAGYFVLTAADGRFQASDLGDGTSFDGLSFATAEATPDGLLLGTSRGTDLVLIGPRSTEFWQDAGGEDFPFTRTTSTEVGTLAAGSVARVDQTLAWVADDATVRLLDGYQPRKISPLGLDRLIADDASRADIRSFSWKRRGHVLMAVRGTTWCWVYDLTTGEWHERESYGRARWACNSHVEMDGLNLFGLDDSSIGVMDHRSYTESGQPIVMTIEPPPAHSWPGRVGVNAIYIDVLPGVGLNSVDAHLADPGLLLDYSEDGGRTWSAERQIAVGAQGEVGRRVIARRLGTSGSGGRRFRMRMSAGVVRGITAVSADVESLAP